MGRKSTKENKNIYQISRESAGLTREAAENLTFISADRIADIEDKKMPRPDEVVCMAKNYKNPFLCNHYCANECEIGKGTVSPLKKKSLSKISIEMLNTLNYLNDEKNRFMEIVEDENISQDELDDFQNIQERLQKMATVIDSLQLWIKQYEIDGKMPEKIQWLRGR